MPLIAATVLAIILVAGIISLINSIPYSIRTIYKYSETMLGLGPRGDPTLTPHIVEWVSTHSPVKLDRVVGCRVSPSQVKSIVGKWPFVVLGFEPSDMDYFLRRLDVTGISGRLPLSGKPEAVVSEPVARNLGLHLGSELLGPDKNESYSPNSVRVVGIVKTELWTMFTSFDYLKENHFPPVNVALAFAQNKSEQSTLDHWAANTFKGNRAQIFAYFQIEKQTNEMFKTLYKILNVVIGVLVLDVTFMMGMLINIFQGQRLVEFGLLQAIGFTKKQLMKRMFGETFIVVVLGWIIGVFLAFVGLIVAKKVLMDPSAYALNLFDTQAFAYTLVVPVAVLVAGALTIASRFRKFDPVGIVERRLV